MNSLLRDLEIAKYCDEKLYETLPVTFNHIFSTGYFTTPSARMACEGEIGVGYASVPPYEHWNAMIQPFSHLEISTNYRVFCGIEDPGLSKHGFGDFSDRGANFKIALLTPEDSLNRLPGIAFGIEDFMGTKRFTNYFVVGTKVWMDLGLETSLGYGAGRYTHGPSRGFFGGAAWFPFHRCCNKWINGISLAAEYDATNYKDPEKEPHPDGHIVNTPINFGIKYQFCNIIDLSASRIRGDANAFAASLRYNWGKTTGIIPKISDPIPYTAPVDREPLGCYRPENVMIQNMYYTFEGQGFQMRKSWIQECCGYNRLWISLINCRYREEHIFRMRIQQILASLLPSNISDVVVIIESMGLPCQQYTFSRELLLRYANHCICPFEFDVLTPREEANIPCPDDSHLIFSRRYDLWRCRLSPRFETFLGSSKGKFKYDLGIKADFEGFLPGNVYYEFQGSYTLLSTLNGLGDFDLYNPSQLPVVATDYIRYRQNGAYTWDRLYLQKSWNHGRGFFSRAALGYFQVNYAGIAGEILWYPTNKYFAIGAEGAVVKKRSYAGFGFQSKLKQLDGYTPTYHPYSTLQQFFLDFYLDFPELSMFTKVSVGQFLARDKGVRLEATRYFESGLRITGWMTFTDANDMMHGEKYYNRGIAVELPLDIFYRCSSRRVWNYGMAAWLRDAGYSTSTGKSLFETLNRERRW